MFVLVLAYALGFFSGAETPTVTAPTATTPPAAGTGTAQWAHPARPGQAIDAAALGDGDDHEVERGRTAAQAWLTDVLERMISSRTKAHELERLLPWTWKAERLAATIRD